MASMYGGQGAAGFANGVMAGYSFVDKAKAAKEESEARRLKMDKMKMDNDLYQVAVDDAIGTKETAQEQELVAVKKQVEQLEKTQKKQNGAVSSSDINNLTVVGDLQTRDKAVQTWKSRIKSNPNAYKALGIKDPDSISVVSIDNADHKKKMVAYLGSQGVTSEEFGYDTTTEEGKKAWDTKVREFTNLVPAIIVDNQFIDLNSLGIGIGSGLQMTPEQKAQQEGITKQIYNLMDGMASMQPDEENEGNFDPNDTSAGDRQMTEGPDFDPNDPVAGDAQMEQPPTPLPADATGEPVPEGTVAGPEPVPAKPDPRYAVDPVDMSPSAIKGRQDSRPDYQPDMVNNYDDFISKLDRHETSASSDRYTQQNPTSSAYGRGQVINETNATMARKLGLSPEQARTREGQDAVLKGLYNEYSATLKINDLPKTQANYYALHQLGGPQGTKYIKGNIDDKVIKSMRGQYGPKINSKLNDGEIIQKWTEQFGSNEDGTTANIATAVNGVQGVVATGKPATGPDMEKIYTLLGKKYPGSTSDDDTAKMKNYGFLLGEGIPKAEAYQAVFGKANAGTSRKQAGYIQAVEGNVAYDKKIANGVKLTPEESAYYDANLEIQEDFKDNAGIQTKRYNNDVMKKERVNVQDAFTVLDKVPDSTEAVSKLKQSQFAMRQSNKEAFKLEATDIAMIKGLQDTSNETADILNRAAYGDIKDADRDAVATIKQTIATTLPKGLEKYLPDDWQATMEATTVRDTATGLLQAQFIKAISGATVTDEERRILSGIILGGNGWNNKATLTTALTEFYNLNADKVDRVSTRLKAGVSPYDGHRYSQLTPLGEEYVPERGKKKTKKIVKRGTLSDGTKVVQYEDGTQGVE